MPVQIGTTGTSYYKRFTPSSYTSIDFVISTESPLQNLQVPLVVLGNSYVGVRSACGSVDPTISSIGFLVVLLVGAILVFIVNFYRYMKYNPDENNDPYYCFKAIFLFLICIVKYIAVGIFLFLLVFTGYLFCFYKFQRTLYMTIIDLGSDKTGLHQTYFAFFFMNFTLMMLAVFIQMFNLTNTTDFFLIDWEKEKELGKF